jgi:hypothetical protein
MVLPTAPYFAVSSHGEVLQLRVPKSPLSVEAAVSRGGGIGSLLDSAERWISSRLDNIENPGVRLDLCLPPDADLLYGHKLHLYAIALADRLKAVTGVQFRSVKLTKRHCVSTKLALASAIPAQPPADATVVTIITRRSYAKPGFAQVVHENTQSIRDIAVHGKGLRLTVSYVTGLPRTWSRLWGPTIMGIVGPLGSSHIVELGFDHCSVGERLEHQVQITISASPAA